MNNNMKNQTILVQPLVRPLPPLRVALITLLSDSEPEGPANWHLVS